MHRRQFKFDPRIAQTSVGARTATPRWEVEPVVCAHRIVYNTDLRTGKTVPVPISSTPGVVDGAGVVVASDDGWLRFLDRSLATVYWERRLDGGVYAPIAFLEGGDTFVVATTAGLVGCFGLRGDLRWVQTLGHGVLAAPLPFGERVLVATLGHRYFVLSADSGDVEHVVDLPAPWCAAVGAVAAHRDVYATPVMTADGGAVVCCGEHVVRLNHVGHPTWTADLGVTVKASPAVIDDGSVAVCSVDGRCHELDATTGAVKRIVCLGSKVVASPAIVNGVLVIGSQNGQSAGIDIDSWTVRWRSAQTAPFSYTGYTVLPDGGVVAVNGRGNAECRRPEDGSFVWETSQVLGLPDHEPEMHVTPVVGSRGDLYATSYRGDVYRFQFRADDPEGDVAV